MLTLFLIEPCSIKVQKKVFAPQAKTKAIFQSLCFAEFSTLHKRLLYRLRVRPSDTLYGFIIISALKL